MFPRTLLLAIAILCLSALSRGADEPADRIAKLLVRLGSSSFTEREAATKELDGIGAPALPALRKATTSDDVETRRRAEEIISRIEKRLETARLLAPSKVTLRFRDTPLKEAVAEFVKASGQRIALDGEESKFAARKVTLEMTDVPFWQALDRFCEAAGLIEPGSVSMPLRVGSWSRMGRAGPRQLPTLPPPGPSAISTQIVLADGKHQPVPTYHGGAARVRAFATNSAIPATRTSEGELIFSIGLGLEEQVPLQKVLSLRIDRAIDEHGQDLKQLGAAPADAEPTGAVFLGNFSGQPQAIISAAGQHPVRVKLKEGEKSAKLLKELTGCIGVEVRTPPEPVLVVDNILKAVATETKGAASSAIKIHSLSREDDGSLTFKFTLETRPDPAKYTAPTGWPNQVPLGWQPAIRIAGYQIGPNGDLDFSLVDAQGAAYEVVGDPTRTLTIEAHRATHETTVTFRPKPGQGPAAKFIYRESRLTSLEIPFTLKNLPLP